jgi:Ca2+/Na+ antiporter
MKVFERFLLGIYTSKSLLKTQISILENKMIFILVLRFLYLMLCYEGKLKYHIQNEKLRLRYLNELKLDKRFVFLENDSEKNDYSTKNEI